MTIINEPYDEVAVVSVVVHTPHLRGISINNLACLCRHSHGRRATSSRREVREQSARLKFHLTAKLGTALELLFKRKAPAYGSLS